MSYPVVLSVFFAFSSMALIFTMFPKLPAKMSFLVRAIVCILIGGSVFFCAFHFLNGDLSFLFSWCLLSISIFIAVFGLIIFSAIAWIINKLPFRFVFGKWSITRLDGRLKVLLIFWIFTLWVTVLLMILNYKNPNSVSENFLIAWLGDFSFFTVLGLAVAVISIATPQLLDFDSRMSLILDDPSSPGQENFKSKIKKLALICKSVEREYKFVEYSAKYGAFKVEATTKTTVENLLGGILGDLYVEDNVMFSFSPDQFQNSQSPDSLGVISDVLVKYESDGREESLLDSPVEITPEGTRISPKFFARQKQQIITIKYWVWAKDGEEWLITSSRFTLLDKTRLVNLIVGSDLNISQGVTKNSEALKYGQALDFKPIKNLEEGEFHKLFTASS